MTQICEKEFKCGVCGNESSHKVLMSTNIFGWPVLETRLSEMPRSTMHAWFQRCPSCGYCAPDISDRVDKTIEIVQSNPYREQLEAQDFPELASTFLCWSLIQESSERFSDAGWASVYAAWACDDTDYYKSAQLCRMRAAHLFLRAREKGQTFSKGAEKEEAVILTDLLRRAERFSDALMVCENGLKKGPTEKVKKFLEHEKALIEKRDSSDANQSAVLLRKVLQKMKEKRIKRKIFTREELNKLIAEAENDFK